MSALDRLLCERLGIEPISRDFRVIDEMYVSERPYVVGTRAECLQWLADVTQMAGGREKGLAVQEVVIYPALSTTGNGMVLLMEALRAKTGRNSRVGTESNGRCRAIVFPNAPTFLERFNALSSGAADTAPMALALAAAAALGVEVPDA